MGNTQAATEIAQANCPLVRLVEDVFVIVLRNMKLCDFISLMSTCKLFYYHRLAPNNYFWAQFCAEVGGINILLKNVQQGRRFVIDGKTIDLNAPILPTDKTTLSHFDFRSELEKYYVLIFNRMRLYASFSLKPPFAFNVLPTITVNSTASKWPHPWINSHKSRQHYVQDYYYFVDFSGNPAMVAPYLFVPVLCDHIGGREVVYNNSSYAPPIFNTAMQQISRSYQPVQSRTAYNMPKPPTTFPPKKFNNKVWRGRFHPYSSKRDDKL
eukprot:TRINITY_DN8465_c0_g1_i1.p1 TRINITY_DN8465_c0_g1~~TRINITY_DN8465_c0_g1_i1.p1  ORF type:complete len:268 (-),score=14.98 TRINITY_DN8465_c0_g1_i1:60-863(-)